MRQLLRAGLTSGAIHVMADTLAQLVESRGSMEEHDYRRTLTFGIVGATLHGPYFQRAFAMLDKRLPATAVLKKTAITQVLLNPPYLVLLFAWLGTLEGRQFPEEVAQNVSDKIVPAFWAGNLFWPVANFLNFRYLPPQHRVAYVASCGAVWNTFISLLNKHKDQQTAEIGDDAAVAVAESSSRSTTC